MDAHELPPGPRVGAQVLISRDVLVEVARQVAGAPSCWQMLARGTSGSCWAGVSGPAGTPAQL